MITLASLTATLGNPDITFPLVGSIIAGGLIGAEREFQGKAAGLRTHILVCFASALMTLAALLMADWTAHLPEGTQIVSDMSRMPHAILTGIGFLCAGVIFREGTSVHGLTTAASLWLTAAIGITFGTGLMELAVVSTLIALFVLLLFRVAQLIAPTRAGVCIELVVDDGQGFGVAQATAILARHGYEAQGATIEYDRDAGTCRYTLPAALNRDHADLEIVARSFRDDAPVREFRGIPIVRDEFRPH